jgi:hypothetical protein
MCEAAANFLEDGKERLIVEDADAFEFKGD